MSERQPYAHVVVEVAPAHLDRPFDYAVPEGMRPAVGHRVRLRFAGRRTRGWVVGLADETATPPSRVRALLAVDGEHPWFDEDGLRFYRWVAQRYAAPLAAVLRHAVPDRVAAVEREPAPPVAPSTAALAAPAGPVAAGRSDDWTVYTDGSRMAASVGSAAAATGPAPAWWWSPEPGEDVAARLHTLVARCVNSGRRALVLVPDPATTVADALLQAAGASGVDLRVQDPAARYRAALRCRDGPATLAVGLRGACLAPLPDLGLVVVVDEANPAYKERRAPRHHARDVALARARLAGATCVLTSALPSAACWRLLSQGHVLAVTSQRERVRGLRAPVHVVDLADPRPGRRRARLTLEATRALRGAVEQGQAAVVLAARRGEGSVPACSDCGLRVACGVCDGALAPTADEVDWTCLVCGARVPRAACVACGGRRFAALAAGAGRLASELARAFPAAEVARMEGFDAPGPRGRPAIGVMTRGSVVQRPTWLAGEQAAVTVVLDADALLGRPRFDAGEDALRLWLASLQWSRSLVLQTREPTHVAVGALVRRDAEGFWRREAERPGRARLAAGDVARGAPWPRGRGPGARRGGPGGIGRRRGARPRSRRHGPGEDPSPAWHACGPATAARGLVASGRVGACRRRSAGRVARPTSEGCITCPCCPSASSATRCCAPRPLPSPTSTTACAPSPRTCRRRCGTPPGRVSRRTRSGC